MLIRFVAVKRQFGRVAAFCQSLATDTTAGTTMFVAFAVPVFVGALGLGVDTGSWYIEKRRIQQIADAAALGAARVKGAGQNNTTALSVATRDAGRNGFVASGTTTLAMNSPPTSGTYAGKSTAVEVIVTKQLPSLFSSYLLGSSARTITGRSVGYTPYVQTRNLEVAIVMDVSVSMASGTEDPQKTKMEAQQDAAKALVNVVVQANQNPFTSRVALAPFSSSVNVGSVNVGSSNYFKLITNINKTNSWTGVTERTGNYKFKDDPPSSTYGYFGEFRTKKSGALGDYASYVSGLDEQTPSSSSRIRPLSSSKTDLTSWVNGMTTGGSTAGHLGLAWAWYLLSPKWDDIFTGTAVPNAYDSTGTYKAIVVMSDFDFNTWFESNNGSSNAQFEALCTAIKAAGVKIFTVGYNVSGTSNNTRRTNCASPNDSTITYTYTTTTVTGLLAAFSEIAASSVIGSSDPKLRIVE